MVITSVTQMCLLIRVVLALLTRTVFQPDEFYQGLEPAHALVFGFGHLTWEWVSYSPIRSILYPALNVPVYWLLKATGLRETLLLITAPKVLHGVLAAGTDIGLYRLTRRVLGERYAWTAVFLSLTSFFHALSLSRSLSNSLETSLTTLALSHYPWKDSSRFRSDARKTLLYAALACAIRPTNAVIWVFMMGALAWRLRTALRSLAMTVLDAICISAFTLAVIFVADTAYYGTPTFTPYNFLITNLSSVSKFYGSNPWHYYLFQALPILCTTALPFVLHGIWLTTFDSCGDRATRTLLGCAVWTITVYSFAAHKEWRFIQPILPILHLIATKSLVHLSDSTRSSKKAKPAHRSLNILPRHKAFLLLSLPVSAYIVLFYCSGPISVIYYIRTLPQGASIGFLTPCHSTPGQAYLHRSDLLQTMWALGCEPPLRGQDLTTYADQTKVFFTSPSTYLTERFPPSVDPSFPLSPFPSSVPGVMYIQGDEVWRHEWPEYLVLFGALLKQDKGAVRSLLDERGYGEVWKAGREWEGEDERKGGMKVWRFEG